MEVAFVQSDGIHCPDGFDAISALSGLTVGLFHLRRPSSNDAGSDQWTE